MVNRLMAALGGLGTLGSTVANLGCCGLGILGPAGLAGAASALTPVAAAWGYQAMYASLGLVLLGLGSGVRRHRCPYPIALALAGAVALLVAFHDAWDVTVFAALVLGGSAALAAAAACDVWRGIGARPPRADAARGPREA